jgi:mRNA interferase MazF
LSIKIVSRGEVWLVNFDPTITKNLWHIKIVNDAANGLDKMSAVDVLQIRSVSIDRLTKKIGRVSSTMMEEIVAAIAAVIEYQ